MEAIVVRDESTWPPEVKAFLEQHKELIIDKKIFENKKYKLGNDPQRNKGKNRGYKLDVFIEANKLPLAKDINQIYKKYNNKFYDSCNKFDNDLGDILQKYSLLVVHYTRLTEYEIDKIEKNGLQLPNREILSKRIDKLVEQEYLTIEDANELKKHKAYSDSEGRAFRFHFTSGDPFEGETDDTKEDYIIRLLRSWGGEALYWGNEYEPIGKKLRKIGIPCILESIVPCSILPDYDLPPSVICELKKVYLRNNNITYEGEELLDEYDEYDGYDACTKKNITNDDMKKIKITRIIRYDENKEEFIRFTGCDKWDEQLTL